MLWAEWLVRALAAMMALSVVIPAGFAVLDYFRPRPDGWDRPECYGGFRSPETDALNGCDACPFTARCRAVASGWVAPR